MICWTTMGSSNLFSNWISQRKIKFGMIVDDLVQTRWGTPFET
jgi:hypothetical protein